MSVFGLLFVGMATSTTTSTTAACCYTTGVHLCTYSYSLIESKLEVHWTRHFLSV